MSAIDFTARGLMQVFRNDLASTVSGKGMDTVGRASVAQLMAATSPSRGAGTRWYAENHLYDEAPPDADDHHVETAGGVRLYVRPGAMGFDARAFGCMGDGTTDDAPAAVRTMAAAVAHNRPAYFPAGRYNLAAIAVPTFTAMLRIIGDGRGQTRLLGSVSKTLAVIAPGAGASLHCVSFEDWQFVIRTQANAGLAPFQLLEASDCHFENVLMSPISDYASPANGGITELRFVNNTCRYIGQTDLNSAGIRIDSNRILSGFVAHNEICHVGGTAWGGQKDGISLGAVTTDSTSTLLVEGNRIYDVGNNVASSGGSGHISGITVFGQHTRVTGNSIIAVASTHSGNTDQYGIYTKSSYSTILGNTLLDAGGNAACIMTKGMPNDLNGAMFNADNNDCIIADNTIRLVTPLASGSKSTGIVTYNSGMLVHDNIIEGVTEGILLIPPTVASVARTSIHHNKLRNLKGTAVQTVAGIILKCPDNCLVESNELTNLGTGIETAAYGVYMYNAEKVGAYRSCTIRNNRVSNITCATSSSARAMNLNFDNAGTYTDLAITDNYVNGSGRGVHFAFAGAVSGLAVSGNRINGCTIASIGASGGSIPNDSLLAGNTIDGRDYVSAPDGDTTPTVSWLNALRISNTTPTTITNFDDGGGSQHLQVDISGGATTIANNAAIKLAGGTAWTPASGGMIRFVRNAGVWKEAGRTQY